MPEEVTDPDGNLLCPKCGTTLWFYRIYQEPLTEGEDILNIEYAEWDNEEVACPNCNHKPAYKWVDERIVLV